MNCPWRMHLATSERPGEPRQAREVPDLTRQRSVPDEDPGADAENLTVITASQLHDTAVHVLVTTVSTCAVPRTRAGRLRPHFDRARTPRVRFCAMVRPVARTTSAFTRPAARCSNRPGCEGRFAFHRH